MAKTFTIPLYYSRIKSKIEWQVNELSHCLSLCSLINTVITMQWQLADVHTAVMYSTFIPLLQSLPRELAQCHPAMRYAKVLSLT